MNKKITLLFAMTLFVGSAVAQVSFSVKEFSTWSVNTEFDYTVTSYLHNNTASEADTAFEWYVSGAEMPSEWEITVCSGDQCVANPEGNYDFNVPKDGKEAFKLGFSFFEKVGDGSAWVVAKSKLNGNLIDSFKLQVSVGTASIEKTSDKEVFTAYPNPAKDKVTVTFSNGGAQQVLIYDILGSLKKKELVSSGSSINVSDLPKGVYIMKIEGDNSYSKMIQKQ